MKLRPEQLQGHLEQGLSPIYLIFGDEQMLVEETSDLIRQQVRKIGADERQVWHVEGRFNWSEIQWQEQTLSLFSSQRLLEIRLPSGAPGKEGGEALRNYVANIPADTTLLIISGKIDARSQKSKWFTEIDRVGVTIPVWPIDIVNLPRWISQRMQQKGLQTNQQISVLIAERVEGNLFAAAQEIDKLHLLCPDGKVDEETVLASVADNARFEVFGLMDTVFSGQVIKIPRMIARLRGEGLDIMSVFSAVSWSLHRAVDMAIQLEQGTRLEQVFASQKPPIWEKSRPMMREALSRHKRPQWQKFLQQMAKIDQAAKGSLKADPWALLEILCLQVAGIKIMNQE